LASGRYPNLARIADGGAIADGGSIVGWPSMSLPGHLSVYTGAYQGHHGLLSNSFRDRASGVAAPGVELWEVLVDPSVAGAAMTAYLSTDVETLFEAVGRSFPDSQTASISELAFRGATWVGLTEGPPAPPMAGDYTKYRVADQLTVVQVEQMVAEIGLPKLLAASFYLTDGVGEGTGPHGDALRAALVETDARVGQVLDVYEREAGFEDTVFVLTADHGMAMQDSARTSEWSAALSASGVSVTTYGHMIYFD
jgi:predicted AlkP superfamily pyrophosphatase or phosphodiesterase